MNANEESLFAQALEILDLHERTAFLDRARELDDGKYRMDLRLGRLRAGAGHGEHVVVAAEADLLAKRETLSGSHSVDLACTYALCIVAAVKDATLRAAEREKRIEHYGATAVDLLTRAHAAGSFKEPGQPDELRTHKAFDPLRSRQDFKKLLSAVEAEKRFGVKDKKE
jgi:hypothetical protein